MIVIEVIDDLQITSAALVAGGFSFLIAVIIAITRVWHGKWTHDWVEGVQKVHTVPTPRVGGLAIYLAAGLGYIYTRSPYADILLMVLLAAIPAFLLGFIEDLTHRIDANWRLGGTCLSVLLGIWVTGYRLTSVDLGWIDLFLDMLVIVSVVLTVFSVAGVANAFNIIDGTNGLAAGMAMLALFGMTLIAHWVQDAELVWMLSILLLAVAGFFLVNWPLGKLFLGDGGSYLLGFWVAWGAVMLVERQAQVAAFSILLLVAYPVMEVAYTMYRRLRNRQYLGRADYLHLHSLLQTFFEQKKSLKPLLANSLAGSLLVAAHAVVMALALSAYQYPTLALALCVVYAFVYVFAYRWLRNKCTESYLQGFIEPR